ncbi:MAG: MgtC/SapB family protein [Fibrobacteraceae bacterium]
MELNVFYRLACALALGFLIGLQREHSFNGTGDYHPAGIRTFAITGLLGGVASLISSLLGSPAPFVVILCVIGLLLAVAHIIAFREIKDTQPGLTTSVTMLAVYLLGALCWYGRILEAAAIGVCLLWLLTVKSQLHDFARKVSKEDLIATLKFALISAVILPILPKTAYGPAGLEVLSPYKLWLFVVFISGISFVGYILIKVIGPGKGIGITGLLGGLASSTALTWNLTQRSRDNPEYGRSLALGVVIAWSVMYIRVYAVCLVVNPAFRTALLLPLLIPPLPGLAYAFYMSHSDGGHSVKSEYTNPFELLPAIKFGAIFACVLFVASAAQHYLGESALMLSSFIAGFADIDAIALSALEMESHAAVGLHEATIAIALAGVGNTICKGSLVFIFGSPEMRRAILPPFLLILATAAIVITYIF